MCVRVWVRVCARVRMHAFFITRTYARALFLYNPGKGTVEREGNPCGAREPKSPLVFTKNLLISFIFSYLL